MDTSQASSSPGLDPGSTNQDAVANARGELLVPLMEGRTGNTLIRLRYGPKSVSHQAILVMQVPPIEQLRLVPILKEIHQETIRAIPKSIVLTGRMPPQAGLHINRAHADGTAIRVAKTNIIDWRDDYQRGGMRELYLKNAPMMAPGERLEIHIVSRFKARGAPPSSERVDTVQLSVRCSIDWIRRHLSTGFEFTGFETE